jgi:hypothetical protein
MTPLSTASSVEGLLSLTLTEVAGATVGEDSYGR